MAMGSYLSATQTSSLRAPDAANYGKPYSSSANTFGSVQQGTAWSTSQAGGSTGVAAYSKRTKGSTLSWDDDTNQNMLPDADPGSPYMLNRG